MENKYLWVVIVLAIAVLLLFSGVSLEIVSPRYDVNSDGIIDAQDAAIVWANLGSSDTKYDMNDDLVVDAQDAAIVWSHLGDTPGDGNETILDWLVNLIWG